MKESEIVERIRQKADLSDPPISKQSPYSSFTERLIDVLSAAGYDYREYSGRGMFGKQCVGVDVSDLRDLMGLLAEISKIDPEFTAMLIQDAQFDDMGRGMIIYWPKASITKEV